MASGRIAARRLSNVVTAFRLTPSRVGSSSAASSSSSASASRLVADRIVELTAIDVDGVRHKVKGLTKHTLLRALMNHRLIDPESHRLDDINACTAECRVMVASEWLDKLPPRSEEEYDTLAAAATKGKVDPHDRLGCQIRLSSDLQGMVVAVPEPKPWRIP
ncbi:hypothetical protein KP509_19G060100 [Ceratopteris richardii]|uniref:Ferredoxin n=1 Tax=Ceratopteris richardii TaxID=49495 RepID=A0A8T2SLK3_CERRI|nr:hypothetical protein KP509_19G060100 [Ceratopteris richardii]